MPDTLSGAQARRIALAAQGFGRRPTSASSTGSSTGTGTGTRQLGVLIGRLGVLQLDSVNVFERSHYLPAFARLGAYDKSLLDRLVFAEKSNYLEYWAHEAAIIPKQSWPLFRWRMNDNREKYGADAGGWVQANGAMLEWLRSQLAARGALAASDIEHPTGKGAGGWWGWSDVKSGLEWLFRFGEVVSAGRHRFERRYALSSDVLPSDLLDRDVSKPDAIRELLALSARAHGIGTVSDLADYFRIKNAPAALAIRQLTDSGELIPVTVSGWNRAAFLHRDARLPRRVESAALLSPFDPVVWERSRAERLFGFHYRIEIYTPAAKRIFGYYSLPLLLDDALVGRVDLKSDRQKQVLRVQSSWTEPDAPADTAARLAALLRQNAAWQGLEHIEVMGRGNLASAVAAELGLPVIAA